MAKIDTSGWKDFVIGDLFEKLNLKIKKENFNKALDVSEERTEEFNLPVVNAKHGNNGIMFYGREDDFEYAEMTIDIVQNGAIATGDVYAQPQKTGVLWDAYLIKPKMDIDSPFTLHFLATVIEKTIKDKFSYDDKCVWDKAKLLTVKLPIDKLGVPDWKYMGSHMSKIMRESQASLENLKQYNHKKQLIDTTKWKDFVIGDLFIIKRPSGRCQTNYEDGDVPFVASGDYNNGVVKYLKPKIGEELEKGRCITVSPVDGSSFYQEEDFLGRGGGGSSIILLYNENLNLYNGLFIATVIRSVCNKYLYNDMANSKTIQTEKIRLPIDEDGNPDFAYMEDYMKSKYLSANSVLIALQ